jgi:hypothetical protein
MSGISKYSQPKSHYHPIGGTTNGKRNMYETGTCDETYYTDDEFEFLKAMDHYKQEHDRRFPTYHEVLQVLKSLGYHKETQTDGRQATRRIAAPQAHSLPTLRPAPEYGPYSICGPGS